MQSRAITEMPIDDQDVPCAGNDIEAFMQGVSDLRAAALALTDACERLSGLSPTTAEIRHAYWRECRASQRGNS